MGQNQQKNSSEIKNDILEKTKKPQDWVITMNEISSGGGYTGSSGSAGAVNPGASFENLLGIGTTTESVVIKGQNFEQMKNISDDIKTAVQDLSTISSVNVNVQDNTPEVHLKFDMDYIGRNNFTLDNITSALSTFGKEYSSGATFLQGTQTYDITLKYADEFGVVNVNTDKTIDDLKNLEVTGTITI